MIVKVHIYPTISVSRHQLYGSLIELTTFEHILLRLSAAALYLLDAGVMIMMGSNTVLYH